MARANNENYVTTKFPNLQYTYTAVLEYIPVVYAWDCAATTTSTELHITVYDIIQLCKP